MFLFHTCACAASNTTKAETVFKSFFLVCFLFLKCCCHGTVFYFPFNTNVLFPPGTQRNSVLQATPTNMYSFSIFHSGMRSYRTLRIGLTIAFFKRKKQNNLLFILVLLFFPYLDCFVVFAQNYHRFWLTLSVKTLGHDNTLIVKRAILHLHCSTLHCSCQPSHSGLLLPAMWSARLQPPARGSTSQK